MLDKFSHKNCNPYNVHCGIVTRQTFRTPIRPAKRVHLRQMPAPEHPVAQLSRSFGDGKTWDEEECQVLVEFILLMSSGDKQKDAILGACW